MKKRAGIANLGAEEVAQTDMKVLTRARTRAEAETLFSQANAAKAKEQRLLGNLFHQTQAAETMSPMLAKTAQLRSFKKLAAVFRESAPKRRHRELLDALEKRSSVQEPPLAIDEFFEKLAAQQPTQAQRLYPELLKAASAPGVGTRPTPTTTKRTVTPLRGAAPVQSHLSGGAA